MAIDDYYDPPIRSTYTYPTRAGGARDPEQMRAAAHRLTDRADALLDAAMQTEAKLARFGSEPAEGSVVRFKKRYGERKYDYAAIRKNGRWFITQGRGPYGPKPAMTWAQFVEFVGDGKLKIATGWKELRADDQSA